MFTLGHISDWHATSLAGAGVSAFMNKRILGWLSWNVRRSRTHRPEVLEALFDDLRAQSPDHVAVTGDLTNVALEQEFEVAAHWLQQLGSPDWISVVPGNHDAYVAVAPERSLDLWAPFMLSDAARASSPAPLCAPRARDFPTLRVRGDVALVGLCSAVPSAWFLATGRLGADQVERLEKLLRELRDRDLCRIVLVHHPPTDHLGSRRSMTDSALLRDALSRVGAELVLHGHGHRSSLSQLEGPEGPIPVAGVRSASDVGLNDDKRAQYHLYRIERSDGGFRIGLSIRGYDRESGSCVAEGERAL